jgi:hypothetical protein
MRQPGSNDGRGTTALVTGFLLIGLATSTGLGDDPPVGNRLARLFRLGGHSDTATKAAPSSSAASTPALAPAAPPSPGSSPALPSPALPPPSTPETSTGPAPRITAQPRVSRPATEADPLVTRIAVGRSDQGGQFGMFLQVFADGTVIDGEGIHHLTPEALRPLLDALRQGDLYRVRGHCGNPSTDFIVTSHVVVYERALGKLRATSFSYSGNPHGCDASIHKLHAALEAIQTKLSTSGSASGSASVSPGAASGVPAPPSTGVPVLGLTAPE